MPRTRPTAFYDKAENDRQKVIDAIHKLEDDREEAREDYRDLLNDFITDATRKLAEIGEKAPKAAGALASGQHGRYATHVDSEPVVKEAALRPRRRPRLPSTAPMPMTTRPQSRLPFRLLP